MLEDAVSVAVEALSWMDLKNLSERLALARAASQLNIKDVNALRFAHQVVIETIRRLNFIDKIANAALFPQSLNDFKLGVKNFVRIYVYLTKFHGYAFNETLKFLEAGRRVLGWRDLMQVELALGKVLTLNLHEMVKHLSDEDRVALETFHPSWFVQYCFRLLGRSEALKLLRGNTHAPPTYIRINTLVGEERDLLNEIEREGLKLEKVPGLRLLYQVTQAEKPLTLTNPYKRGFFHIQDKSSCLSVEIANPKAYDVVLDVCAAPGAKTGYLAQLMGNQGAIYSIDCSKRRMAVWKREMQRLNVKIATPIIADARHPLPLNVKADIVMLDPPCSSTGAYAKVPSAKWRMNIKEIENLSKVQWEMLKNCACYVKPSGSLVYSTCSLTVEENELVVERFLKLNPEFKLVDAKPRIGLPGLRGLTECQRLYPHISNSNGFFIAKMIKEY